MQPKTIRQPHFFKRIIVCNLLTDFWVKVVRVNAGRFASKGKAAFGMNRTMGNRTAKTIIFNVFDF